MHKHSEKDNIEVSLKCFEKSENIVNIILLFKPIYFQIKSKKYLKYFSELIIWKSVHQFNQFNIPLLLNSLKKYLIFCKKFKS